MIVFFCTHRHPEEICYQELMGVRRAADREKFFLPDDGFNLQMMETFDTEGGKYTK